MMMAHLSKIVSTAVGYVVLFIDRIALCMNRAWSIEDLFRKPNLSFFFSRKFIFSQKTVYTPCGVVDLGPQSGQCYMCPVHLQNIKRCSRCVVDKYLFLP